MADKTLGSSGIVLTQTGGAFHTPVPALSPYRRIIPVVIVVLLTWLLFPSAAVHAAPTTQIDPAAQCAQGVSLFDEGKLAEAQPPLEAGFAKRTQANFAKSAELGDCALRLGLLWEAISNYGDALTAYTVARVAFQQANDQLGEARTLFSIGAVYDTQGQYAQALENYQQAIDVLEDVRIVVDSKQGRANFIAQYASLYGNAATLYHCKGQDDLAFFTSERGRARVFLDSLATGLVQFPTQNAQSLLEHEQETYTIRQAPQDTLARARKQAVLTRPAIQKLLDT